MANPLQFEFGIKDNLSTKLEEIEKKLGKLQEGVAVNIRLGDVSSIKELFDNLDPSKINNITEAIKNLNRAMNVVVSKNGSFTDVKQFDDAEKAARNLASAVEKIDFGKVDSTGKISNMTNEMKAFRGALRDYNEKMVNVQPFKAELSTQALAEFKSSIDKTLSGISVKLGVELDNKTITKDFGIYKGINEAVDYLKKNFSTVNAEVVAPKVDTTALDAAEKKVAELRKELAELQGEPVKPATTSTAEIQKTTDAVEAQKVAVESLEKAQAQMQSVKRKSFSSEDSAYLDEVTAKLNKYYQKEAEARAKFMGGMQSEEQYPSGAKIQDYINGLVGQLSRGKEAIDKEVAAIKQTLSFEIHGFNNSKSSRGPFDATQLERIKRTFEDVQAEYSTAMANISNASSLNLNDDDVAKLREKAEALKILVSVYEELYKNTKSLQAYGSRNDVDYLKSSKDKFEQLKSEAAKSANDATAAQRAYDAEVKKYGQTVEQAKAKLDELIAKKAELEKAPSAPDNSARINQINEQIAAQEKLIAENKKAQEQMKAPQQDATPFNAFSQGFTLAATEIYNAYNTIEKKLSDVRAALGETGFTNLKTKAEAAAEAIQKLAKAFEQLGVSTKTNEKLTEMVIGLGEIVKTVRQSLPSGSRNSILEDFSSTVQSNLNKIEGKLLDIQNAKQKLESAARIGGDNGMMAGELEHIGRLWQMLDALEKKYMEIKRDDAALANKGILQSIDTPANNLIINGKPNDALQQAEAYEKATTRMRNAMLEIDSMQQRLEAKKVSATGIIKTDEIDAQIRALSDFKMRLEGIGNVKTRAKVFDTDWKQMSGSMNRTLNSTEALITTTNRYKDYLQVATGVASRLREDIAAINSKGLKIDTANAEKSLSNLQAWMDKLLRADLSNPHALDTLARQFKAIKSSAEASSREIERAYNKATTTKDSYGDIGHQIEFLKRQRASLDETVKTALSLNVDTADLQRFNLALEQTIKKLEAARTSGSKEQMNAAWIDSKGLSDMAHTEQTLVKNRISDANKLAQEQEALSNNQKRYNDILLETTKLNDKVNAAKINGTQLGVDTANLDTANGKLTKFVDSLLAIDAATLKDKDSLNTLLTTLANLKYEIDQAVNAQNKLNNAQSAKNKKDASKAESDVAKWDKENKTSIESVDGKISALNLKLRELQLVLDAGMNLNLQTSPEWQTLNQKKKDVEDLKAKLEEVKSAGGRTASNETTQSLWKGYEKIKNEASLAKQELESLNKKASESSAMTPLEKSLMEANKSLVSVNNLIAGLHKSSVTAEGFGIDVTKLNAARAELEKIYQDIEKIRNGGGIANIGGVDMTMDGLRVRLSKLLSEAKLVKTDIDAKNSKAKLESANATQKLTAEEQKLADAIKNATNAGKQQNQVLSDLRTMALQYFSVQGIYNFAKEMANITGELELQKTSLQVILNNASKADELYGQIRDLSQMSPFSFMDLMKSTRQLAAFGIETKDLYGTMKSLSDIGAGLNVDVNRLILAYGHTRSYGYLSGIQNRQFENAGIDMIGGLVKQYNDLAKAEEEAGRKADYVTRKDIFKRMRDKSIDFADVEKVILGLDQPGGKFYDMQLKQFDTLGGKLRNLANNYNIMMSELGEKHRGVLMAVVEGLTEVHEHWYRYERIIYGVVAALGVMKAAQLAVGGASTQAFNAAQRQMTQNNIEKSLLRGNYGWNVGTAYNQQDTIYGDQILKSQMSTLQKAKAVMQVGIGKDTREMVLRELGASEKYITRINNISSRTGFLWARASLSMKAFAASAKASMAALASNPMTWIMAAVGGITWLIQKMGETKEQAQGIADAIHDAAQKDIAGIKESLDPYSNLFSESPLGMRGIGGNTIIRSIVSIKEAELQTRNVKDIFDDLKRSLQSQAPLYSMSLFDVFKFKDEAKQVEAIIQKMKDIQYVREVQDLTRDAFQDAIESTGGWRDWGTEGVIKNITDFSDNLTSTIGTIRDDIKNSWSKLPKDIQDSIDQAASDINMSREQYVQQLLLKDKKSSIEMKMYNAMRSNLLSFSPRSFSALGEAATMARDIKPVADQMAQEFNDAYKGNADMMKEAFQSHMLQIFTSSKIAESAKPYVAQEFALAVSEGLKGVQGSDTDPKAFLASYYKSLMSSAIQDGMKAINANTLPADVERITKEAIDKATKSVESSYPEIARAFAGLGKTAKEAFDKEMQDFADSYAKHLNAVQGWQLDMRTKSPFLAGRINSAGSWAEFWDNAKKEFKKGSEELKLYAQKAKIDLKIDVGMSYDTKKLKAMFDAAKAKADALKPMAETTFANDPNIRGQYDAAKSLADNLENLYEIASLAEKEHISLKDDKKTGNQKDPMQEMWRNRIKYIQEAYNAYKQWKKEVGDNDVNGEDPAMKIVDNKFGKYLKEAFGKDFDLKNIKEYQKFLKEMMKMVENTTFKQKDTKRNFLSQLEGMYSQTELAVIQERSKEVADAFKQNITDIEKKYEMFRSIIEVTGDTDLASRMLGYDYQWQNKADLIKKELDKVLGNAGLVGKINIKANTSDEEIGNEVRKYINSVDEKGNPIEDNIKKIDECVDALKKFRDVTQEVMKDSISQYTELIKSATGYQQKITDIETEYKKALEALKGIKDETERNRAEGIARDNRDTALMEASAPYRNLMSNSLTTSKEDAKKAYATAYAQYSQNFKDGVIGADEYTKKIQELNKALRDIDNGAVSEWILFLQGGMKAVREQRIKRDDEIIASAMRDKEVAQKEYDDAKAKDDAKAMGIALGKMAKADSRKNTAQKDKDNNEGKIDKDEKFSKGVNAVVEGLSKFKSGLDLVNSTLDALGLGDTAIGNAAKDASTIMNSTMQGAQALSAFGPWGQAAGAALGIVGGIMQVHDAKLERQITELKQDISKIENYNKTLAKSAERQLGYSRTSNVSALAKMYSSDKSAAGKAMAEYYRNASGSGSYTTYQQEYNNAIEERKKYLEMYNAEEAKKKTDTNALEEYKSKIAELDEQIRYFAEDTAKELWGIDVKSWADQLSDALSTAWQNGTSLAIAYGDTVKSILQSVAKQMLTIGIIQPMFEELQNTIFGKDGKDGLFDINNPEQSMAKVTDYLAKYFGDGGNGQKTITAANEFWNGIEQVLNQYGISAKTSGSSTLSSGIKGMSEETANLLAGYVNALRQDVSAMRVMQAEFFKRYWEVRESGNYDDTNTILAEGKRYDLSTVNDNTSAMLVLETVFVNQYWNDYVQTYTAAYKSLGNIEQQVAAMARVQSKMSDTLSDFYSKFNRVTNGTEHLYIK